MVSSGHKSPDLALWFPVDWRKAFLQNERKPAFKPPFTLYQSGKSDAEGVTFIFSNLRIAIKPGSPRPRRKDCLRNKLNSRLIEYNQFEAIARKFRLRFAENHHTTFRFV